MKQETNNTRTRTIINALLIVSFLLLIIADFLEANATGAHRNITIIIFFVVALYWPQKPLLQTLKQAPTGIKLLFAYFSVVATLQVINAFTSFQAASIFFGVPITGLITALTQALPLLATLTILAYILKQTGWKLVLALQLLLILNAVLGLGYILTTPVLELSELIGHELTQEISQEAERLAKQLMIIPALIGLGLATAAATYTYRRKEYFMQP